MIGAILFVERDSSIGREPESVAVERPANAHIDQVIIPDQRHNFGAGAVIRPADVARIRLAVANAAAVIAAIFQPPVAAQMRPAADRARFVTLPDKRGLKIGRAAPIEFRDRKSVV